MITRRTARHWSRATLARQAQVGQHTVGRIEAGRAWPDLATVARLTNALSLTLSLGVPSTPPRPPAQTRPAGARSQNGTTTGPPLDLAFAGLADPTAAHVIEAILHNSPRMRSQVENLRSARARAR